MYVKMEEGLIRSSNLYIDEPILLEFTCIFRSVRPSVKSLSYLALSIKVNTSKN